MNIFINTNGNRQLNIEAVELESQSSWGSTALGSYESTMELFTLAGVPVMIEWDIPELEETEHIGLIFEGEELVDYDGVSEMPREAIEFLEVLGYDASYAK